MTKSILKVSEFFQSDISPFLLGVFYSRFKIYPNDNSIKTNITYKKSQYGDNSNFEKYGSNYVKTISGIVSNFQFKSKFNNNNLLIEFSLNNDLSLTHDSFFNRLYKKILTSDWVRDNEDNDEHKKMFVRGFMESRGSIDTQRKLIAQDYFFESKFELKKVLFLVDYCSIQQNVFNLNFRELQEQFVKNINQRNTQFRMNLFWYMKFIGLISEYKATIVQKAYNIQTYKKHNIIYAKGLQNIKSSLKEIFYSRLNYYQEYIYDQSLDEAGINKLREQLGFTESDSMTRNQALVDTIRIYEKDECVCCKNDYNIKDRTFIHKKTNKFYFEIHHAISLGKEKELDDISNLVKLCPVCHKCLSKSMGTEDVQKKLIKNLLDNSPKVLEFSQKWFDTTDKNSIVQEIFNELK